MNGDITGHFSPSVPRYQCRRKELAAGNSTVGGAEDAVLTVQGDYNSLYTYIYILYIL